MEDWTNQRTSTHQLLADLGESLSKMKKHATKTAEGIVMEAMRSRYRKAIAAFSTAAWLMALALVTAIFGSLTLALLVVLMQSQATMSDLPGLMPVFLGTWNFMAILAITGAILTWVSTCLLGLGAYFLSVGVKNARIS